MHSIPGAHRIDLAAYPRRDHFAYFSAMAYPYVGLTAEVEVTPLTDYRARSGSPFFLTLLHCVAKAANSVPQLRQRIVDGEIWEFDVCPSSFIVARDDETYVYCTVRTDLPLDAFLPYAEERKNAARMDGSIEEGEEALPCFFISTLPWMRYSSLIQPAPMPADSNPRLTWGKAEIRDGRSMLPLTLLCHHALVDGLHISRFYAALERELKQLELL